jgi:hypothetical protein
MTLRAWERSIRREAPWTQRVRRLQLFAPCIYPQPAPRYQLPAPMTLAEWRRKYDAA